MNTKSLLLEKQKNDAWEPGSEEEIQLSLEDYSKLVGTTEDQLSPEAIRQAYKNWCKFHDKEYDEAR